MNTSDTDLEVIFKELKSALTGIGIMRPGTLNKRYMQCGKKSCRCMIEGKTAWHGPYYQWSLNVAGKTVSLRLSEKQALECEKWIKNHQDFRRLVSLAEGRSIKVTDKLLKNIDK